VLGNMPIPPERPITPLIHYITLNLNISTSKQNIKNLVRNFGGLCISKFKPFALKVWKDNEVTDGMKGGQQFLLRSIMEFLTPPSLRTGGIKLL